MNGHAIMSANKVVPWEVVEGWRNTLHYDDHVILTNGCFDILHVGHVLLLEMARSLGGGLVVGLNADWAVARLKGPTRPVNSEKDRARVIAALASVSLVTIFPSDNAVELIKRVRPHVWVKGGDYTLETLNQDEVAMAAAVGAAIRILPKAEGYSTTNVLARSTAATSCDNVE